MWQNMWMDGWMDLMLGAGVSTALRLFNMVQTPHYAGSTFAVGMLIPKKNPPHGFCIRSLNGKDIVTIQLNKLHCSDCSQSTPN